nr:methyltransferase domain-containing protein [uncultured Caproiciproducens sp.]
MTIFTCPACGEKLDRLPKECVCKNGHSYDVAGEGYVHLLPPNKMHSKVPGDNKEMIASRRRFLESGHYQLFSDRLNELVRAYSGTKNPIILDAGCGEGYYTGRLADDLVRLGFTPQVFGFDISKFAVKAAAKKYRQIQFAVASIFSIPVETAAADCVLDVFAPIVESELNRALKPGGHLILAVPGRRHLYGLKEILYDAPYENESFEADYEGFTFIDRVPVEGNIMISGNQIIQDLFTMTPYYYKTGADGVEKLQQTDTLKTHIEFDFLIYQKG